MSLFLFFFFDGIIALILIYVALGASLLRKKIITSWRLFRILIYLALFIGVIHANLRGTDFQSVYIQIVYDALFAGALLAFCLKRIQFYRVKLRTNKKEDMSKTNNKT